MTQVTFCPKQHDQEMAAYLSCTPEECGLRTRSVPLFTAADVTESQWPGVDSHAIRALIDDAIDKDLDATERGAKSRRS